MILISGIGKKPDRQREPIEGKAEDSCEFLFSAPNEQLQQSAGGGVQVNLLIALAATLIQAVKYMPELFYSFSV